MCNILDNRKIKMIRKESEGNILFLLWMLMITEAGKCENGGYLMISNGIPYTDETLSMVTDIPLPIVQRGLTLFTSYGMIDQADGAIFISNWRKYQSEDKLEERRRKDRHRQRKHRKNAREEMQAKSKGKKKVSRDSHVSTSRYVTQENRQEKNREEKKTTTEQIRELFLETPFVKITDQELQSLEKNYGVDRLLQAADIAAETWRRKPEERHNPGGYLNTLCISLMVPEWYMPLFERKVLAKESQRRKEQVEAEKSSLAAKNKEEKAATEVLWDSLSEKQREKYLEEVRVGTSGRIAPGKDVSLILAKDLARKAALSCRHDKGIDAQS